MSFKRRVLSALGKDVLLEIGRGLELDVTTRMGVEELRDALAKSKRAKLEAIVQESLSRDTLKDICGAVGLDDTGKEKAALVERILAAGGDKDANGAGYRDLTARALALPFSATQVAGLPHDRSIADRDDVLLHAFIYARHVMLGGDRALPRALDLVVRDPHRRFSPERTTVDLVATRRVDARTVSRVVMGADGVVRATGAAAHTSLAHALHGHLPAYVDVPRVEHTFDTAENRFALEFLGQIRGIIDRVDRLARSKAKPGVFWTRAVRDCEAMRRVLGPFERHDMWNDVGRMGHVPIGSSVLQRRRGYKDVLRHHLALRAAARIPFDRATAERLLGLKDVATLYELWCYFAVVDAVAAVIGRRPDDADAITYWLQRFASVPMLET